MEVFKEILIQAKELIRKCKDREKLKKHLIALNCIGNIPFNSNIDFVKQKNDTLETLTDASEFDDYKEIRKLMQAILSNDHKRVSRESVPLKTRAPITPKIREDRKLKEINEEKHTPTTIKTEELPIDAENGLIFCNFEYACILSSLVQKSLVNNVTPLNTL